MNESNEPDAADVESVRQALLRSRAKAREWNEAPYDGVLGSPPDWIPQADRRRFIAARSKLLAIEFSGSIPTAEEVRSWVKECSEFYRGPCPEDGIYRQQWPAEFDHEIQVLEAVWWASQQQPEVALSALSGDAAVRGWKTLTGSKKAHEETHGTAEEKAERWAAMQREVDRLRKDHPDWSKEDIKKAAAQKFGVDPKTIARHTTITSRKKR